MCDSEVFYSQQCQYVCGRCMSVCLISSCFEDVEATFSQDKISISRFDHFRTIGCHNFKQLQIFAKLRYLDDDSKRSTDWSALIWFLPVELSLLAADGGAGVQSKFKMSSRGDDFLKKMLKKKKNVDNLFPSKLYSQAPQLETLTLKGNNNPSHLVLWFFDV